MVHKVESRGQLCFFGSPGASRADFVSVRVVPLPSLRRVRGGLARHGGDTRPRRVLLMHATRTWRHYMLNLFEFVLEQTMHVHG